MTQQGVQELYMWLSTAWPLVIRPGADPDWKIAKQRELYKTFRAYEDAEVHAAFQKWTSENEKFPTTKNIINEIVWSRKLHRKADPKKTYQMEKILDDGTEFVVMFNGKISFTWDEFTALPSNPEHLSPEEWERRFKVRRKAVLSRLYP